MQNSSSRINTVFKYSKGHMIYLNNYKNLKSVVNQGAMFNVQ